MEHLFVTTHQISPDMVEKATDGIITHRKTTKVIYILVFILLGLGLLLSVTNFFNDNSSVIGVILVSVLVLLFIYRNYGKRIGKNLFAALNPRVQFGVLEFSFDDDYFYMRSPVLAVTYTYQSIMEIVETDEMFLLFISKNSTVEIPKNSFSVGNADDFRAFISQKTGLPVTPIKKGKNPFVFAMVAAAAVFVLMIASSIVRPMLPATYTDFIDGSYFSISLPGSFTYNTPESQSFRYYDYKRFLYNRKDPCSPFKGHRRCRGLPGRDSNHLSDAYGL